MKSKLIHEKKGKPMVCRSHTASPQGMPDPETLQKQFDVWIDKQDMMLEFHVSKRTLFNWRKANILPHSRLGNNFPERRMQAGFAVIFFYFWLSSLVYYTISLKRFE